MEIQVRVLAPTCFQHVCSSGREHWMPNLYGAFDQATERIGRSFSRAVGRERELRSLARVGEVSEENSRVQQAGAHSRCAGTKRRP